MESTPVLDFLVAADSATREVKAECPQFDLEATGSTVEAAIGALVSHITGEFQASVDAGEEIDIESSVETSIEVERFHRQHPQARIEPMDVEWPQGEDYFAFKILLHYTPFLPTAEDQAEAEGVDTQCVPSRSVC